MASLFSVSRFMGRPYVSQPTSWATDTMPEENEDSRNQKRIAIVSGRSVVIESTSDTKTPKSSYPNSETFEEPDYDVLSVKASFGECTDTGGPAENVTQYAIDEESSPRIPSVPDWTHLEFEEGMISEHRLKQERATHLEEMRIVKEENDKLAERVEDLEKELQEAVNELYAKMETISKLCIDHEELEIEIDSLKENEYIQGVASKTELEWQAEQQAKKLLERDVILASNSGTIAVLERQKVELISQVRELNIDKVESQARIAELETAARESQPTKLVKKDFQRAGSYAMNTIAVLKDHKANLIAQVQELRVDKAKSQIRIAELESANELQAMKILGKNAVLASHSDTIEVLKEQRAKLLTQVEELRANANDHR